MIKNGSSGGFGQSKTGWAHQMDGTLGHRAHVHTWSSSSLCSDVRWTTMRVSRSKTSEEETEVVSDDLSWALSLRVL